MGGSSRRCGTGRADLRAVLTAFFRDGFVDDQRASHQTSTLNTTDGTVTFSVITHHHDRKTTRFPCFLVSGHGDIFEVAEWLEKTTDGKFRHLVIKVPDVDFKQPFSHESYQSEAWRTHNHPFAEKSTQETRWKMRVQLIQSAHTRRTICEVRLLQNTGLLSVLGENMAKKRA